MKWREIVTFFPIVADFDMTLKGVKPLYWVKGQTINVWHPF